jgi:ABC-type lipoprotein export system ATPase subunit
MSSPLVAVINASKSYESGRVIALDRVSLDVNPGEFVAITGPSGSGKTTLLNMIGAMDIPDSGEVIINGARVSTRRELDRIRAEKIGFVFQMHNLIPVLTARQNVEIPMLPRAIRPGKRKDRALQLLDEVQLRSRADSGIHGLSGGERQRVAIARALANSPALLLADEPTGNLDSSTGKEVMDLLHDQCTRTGAALILVTHNENLCKGADQHIRMRDGKIL